MNKYMGFYELKALNIPTVSWKLYSADVVLDDRLLWTVRVAVAAGSDTNLPRAVGVGAEEAHRAGRRFLEEYGDKGIVVYYPYFIAEKSGVMEVNCERTVIEAVDKDLWNLVTHGRKNVTVIIPTGTAKVSMQEEPGTILNRGGISLDGTVIDFHFLGDRAFLTNDEINELMRCSSIIRGRFRDVISEGGSILAEWSYAYNTDSTHQPAGKRYLVFYELRGMTVS